MQRPLPPEELKRRIDAARTLRGLTQAELAKRLADDGHAAYHVGQVERGKMALSGTLRRSLAHHLRVPEDWFTAEEVIPSEADAGDQLDRLEQAVAELARREADASQEREGIMALLATQSKILADITALLARQDEILAEIQRVVAGMPDDEALRLLNEGARQLEAAQAAREARAAQSEEQTGTRRRQAGDR